MSSTERESTQQSEKVLIQPREETVETLTEPVNTLYVQGSQEITQSETLSPPQPEGEAIDIRQQIDNIINELQQEEVLREMFYQTEPEDEGIELNIHDEIQGDIEPFDFENEVEQYDLNNL